MSKWHCTSTAQKMRLRLLPGMATALLLSSPALAEDALVVETDAENSVEAALPHTSDGQPTLALASAPAHCAPVRLASVETLAPAAAPVSKSVAILGGKMSSLERIRLAQSGLGDAPAAIVQPAVLTVPATPAALASAPTVDCRFDAPQIAETAPVVDDRLVLGSLRLSIRKTPLDAQWSKISKGNAARGMGRWLDQTGARAEDDRTSQIAAINRWVNGKIAYADDYKLYRQRDFWASSRETLRRGKGDCEDYAILKMDLLAAMGIERDRMLLVIARDLVRNADHAVLVVKLESGASVMLDNSTDQLLDGRRANDYRPIMSFASNGKWLHGYAMASTAPVTTNVALVSAPSTPAIALLTPASAGN